MAPQGVPQVAHAEDYDSDHSCAKPGTRRDARRRATTSSRPPRSLDRYRSTPIRDGASDSGYSSHNSGAQANTQGAPAVQALSKPVTASASHKSRPIVHRSSSQRSKEKSSRSNSATRQTEPCGDPKCQHTICYNIRSLQYQQAVAYQAQYAPQHAAQHASTSQQYQPQASQPQYTYAHAQAPQGSAAQNVPVLAVQPRPRQPGTARQARPASFHAHSSPALYGGTTQGPPPSTSAYQSNYYAAWVQAYEQQQRQLQQRQAYQQATSYRPPPLQQPSPTYPQHSPVLTSPVSPTFSTAPDYSSGYSARTSNPVYEAAMQRRPTTTLHRTYSARPAQSRAPAMPGSYPRDEPESEESSESSGSEYSEEDERYQRSRARDSRLMSSSSDRRPSLKKQYATSPVLPTRSARDVLRRNPKTDTTLDYISSSDNVDSDRTARAVVYRPRHAYTNSSRSSRRPSVSTTASSGRTKATTVSSGSGLANVIVERNGRHVTYLSQRDREALEYARQQMDDQKLQDNVRAYQDNMRGAAPPPELTVDNILEHERRGSRSHYSGHSRRASRSSSRKPEPTRIEIGGNVIHFDSGSIHLDSGSTMHVRQDPDGASTLVIDSTSGKEKRYHSASQVSGSRRDSRNYGSSDAGSKREETIQEDEIYDQRSNSLSDGISKLQI